jgi:fructose/tagatose bisphosphate aldolase
VVQARELGEVRSVVVAARDQRAHLLDRALVGLEVPVALHVDHGPRVLGILEDA